MARVGNQGRSQTAARSLGVIAFVFCVAGLLTSCNTVGTTGPADIKVPADLDVLDKVRSLDIMPRQAQAANAMQTSTGEHSRAAVYEGTEISDVADARVQPAASGNGY